MDTQLKAPLKEIMFRSFMPWKNQSILAKFEPVNLQVFEWHMLPRDYKGQHAKYIYIYIYIYIYMNHMEKESNEVQITQKYK